MTFHEKIRGQIIHLALIPFSILQWTKNFSYQEKAENSFQPNIQSNKGPETFPTKSKAENPFQPSKRLKIQNQKLKTGIQKLETENSRDRYCSRRPKIIVGCQKLLSHIKN